MKTPFSKTFLKYVKIGVEVFEDTTVAFIFNELYEELVEPNTGYPTSILIFQLEGCPLTRKHRSNKNYEYGIWLLSVWK